MDKQTVIIPTDWFAAIQNCDYSHITDKDELERINALVWEIGPRTIDLGERLGLVYCPLLGLHADSVELHIWD